MAELVMVRMLTCGPNKNYRKGQTLAVDAQRAAALIDEGHAEEVIHGDTGSLQERQGIQRRVRP